MRFKSPLASALLIIVSTFIEGARTATNNQENNDSSILDDPRYVFPKRRPSVCQNVWKYPPNCKKDCTYKIFWRFRPVDDTIEFVITSKHVKRWTGIGFSQDKSLNNSDFIFGWIEDNTRYVMMDAFMPTYKEPISDDHQSISNVSASLIDDHISFRFLRKRNTSDPKEDLALGDEECLYLVFPVEGGTVEPARRFPLTNEFEPHLTDEPICIRDCKYSPVIAKLVKDTPGKFFVTWTPDGNTTSSTSRPPTNPPVSSTSTSTTSTSRPQTSRPSSTSTTSSTTSRPTTTTTSTTTTTTTTRRPTQAQTTPSSSTTTSSTTMLPTTTSSSTTTTTTTSTRPPSSTSAAPSSSSTSTTSQAASSSSTSTSSPTETNSKQAAGRDKSAEQSTSDQQWCAGRWSHPQNCHFQPSTPTEALTYLHRPVDRSTSIRPLPLELSDCSYFAQWQYLESTDSIEFIIQTKTRNRWTGIGFSNSTRMANSDAIIGLIDETTSRHFIMDNWLRDHVMPEIDPIQNIDLNTYGKRENGVTTFRFKRKRITNDQLDFQFTDDSCAYFFFPFQGGSFHAISKRLLKHEVTPSVSRQRICIKSCSKQAEVTAPSQSELPATGGGLDVTANQPTAPATTEQAPPTSQPEVPDTSSSSQAPNLFLLSSSSASPPAASPTPPPPQLAGLPEKNMEGNSNISLSPSNDLSAELDSASGSSSTSASSGHTSTGSNPFNKLAFLTEPSLRWLAGIGCVATLLAMIVFQACFTVYKNKQAYKQNLYRQSAFKQNSYLHHGGYLNEAHHQPSTGSEETQTASLRNSVSNNNKHLSASQVAPQPPLSRSRAQHAAQSRQTAAAFGGHPQQPYLLGGRPVAMSSVVGPHFDEFITPPATESSEQEEEEEEDEEEVDEVDDEEEEFEDDMMIENPFDYGHPQHAHGHPQHHRPMHGHGHGHAHNHRPHPGHYHPGQVHHNHHAHLHSNSSSPHHPNYQHRAASQHSHYRQTGGHHHPAAMQHHAGGHPAHANLHRAHAPSRSQPHQQLAQGNPNSRPDSYFLPSQRRY